MDLFGKRKRVPTSLLPKGHIILVDDDGNITDLGTCTVETLRLTAYVAQEAYNRLPKYKSKARQNVLGRVRNFTETMYNKAKAG